MSPEIAGRLADLHIELVAEAKAYSVFARGGCIALAHRAGDGGFAGLGSSGLMTGHGAAYLVWKEDGPVLAAHGGRETPASAGEVESIRRFSNDLRGALGLAE